MLLHMRQDNIFVYIQRCHQCWFDKLCIFFDSYLVENKYLGLYYLKFPISFNFFVLVLLLTFLGRL